MCDSIIYYLNRHAPQPVDQGVRSSYLMSAPAMKHPGFVDMRTALLTASLAQISFIISAISFCIWTDSVLTCEMSILVTAHLQISEERLHGQQNATNTHLGVGVVDSYHSNIALDFIVNLSSG